jgi:hypothetical protein
MKVDRRQLVLLPLLMVAGGAVRFGGTLIPMEAQAQDEPAAEGPPPTEVTGFRSARFGMGESDVRAAIASDFGAGDDAVRVIPNELDGTTILSVDVHDLIPATGIARVNYVLGYASLSLTRVNIVWGTPVHPEATADDMTKVAVLLQRYFDALGLVPATIIRQRRLPNGTVILFGGADAAGHAVAVIYREGETKNEDGSTRKAFLLRLSYVADPQEPDIYKLEPGSF